MISLNESKRQIYEFIVKKKNVKELNVLNCFK